MSNHAPASTARVAQRLQIVSDYKLGHARKAIAAQEQAQLIDARKARLAAAARAQAL